MEQLQKPNIPSSTATVDVSIIDSTFRLSGLSPSYFLGPSIDGFDSYHCLTYSFMITHHDPTTNKQTRLLFDLGPPKDWREDLPPPLAKRIQGWNADIKVEKNVSEILEEDGLALESVNTLVWR
jgi:hypothetical protein